MILIWSWLATLGLVLSGGSDFLKTLIKLELSVVLLFYLLYVFNSDLLVLKTFLILLTFSAIEASLGFAMLSQMRVLHRGSLAYNSLHWNV